MRLGNIGTFTVRFELIDPGAMGAPGVQRAALSGARQLTNDPAVSCIFDGAQSEPVPVYVGETARLSARATSHLAARWPMRDPWIAYRVFPGAPKHVLHAIRAVKNTDANTALHLFQAVEEHGFALAIEVQALLDEVVV